MVGRQKCLFWDAPLWGDMLVFGRGPLEKTQYIKLCIYWSIVCFCWCLYQGTVIAKTLMEREKGPFIDERCCLKDCIVFFRGFALVLMDILPWNMTAFWKVITWKWSTSERRKQQDHWKTNKKRCFLLGWLHGLCGRFRCGNCVSKCKKSLAFPNRVFAVIFLL